MNTWQTCVSTLTFERVCRYPWGPTARGDGVNFAVFSRHTSRVRLELFDHPDDATSTSVMELDSARNRTGDVWHIWVAGIRPGQLYAYRVDGPHTNDSDCDSVSGFWQGLAEGREATVFPLEWGKMEDWRCLAEPDQLVFAGGIKENASLVRTLICEGPGFLGNEPGETQAAANENGISAAAAGLRSESFVGMKNR